MNLRPLSLACRILYCIVFLYFIHIHFILLSLLRLPKYLVIDFKQLHFTCWWEYSSALQLWRRQIKTQLPKYYKECFDAWSGLNSSTPVTFNDIMNEIIWNNKFICIDKKSVYRNDLVNLGIVKVGDLITDNNLFLHEDPYVPISPERFFIMGVVHSLPSDWKTISKPSVCINEIIYRFSQA